MDVGYYAPAARTTLNPAVFLVFLSKIDLRLATPWVHTLWARAGAFRHPAVVCNTTTDTKHQSQEADATFITSDGSKMVFHFLIKNIQI